MTNLSKYTEELFKDMYWKELDRKDRINSNLTLPAGILTVLAGVGAYYIQHFPSLPNGNYGLFLLSFFPYFCVQLSYSLYTIFPELIISVPLTDIFQHQRRLPNIYWILKITTHLLKNLM